jgi:hypothetical protein
VGSTQNSYAKYSDLIDLYDIFISFGEIISKIDLSNKNNYYSNSMIFENSYCSSYLERNYEKGKSSQTTNHVHGLNSDLELLNFFYEINDLIELENFISENEFITVCAIDAVDEIKKVFGKVNISLKVIRIYEESYFEQLQIRIETKNSIEDSLELLDKFDDDWWIEQTPVVKDRLSVDILYK